MRSSRITVVVTTAAAVLGTGGATAYAAEAVPEQLQIGGLLLWFLLVMGLLLLLVLGVSATRIVPQGKAGVVERFGRYVKTESAGLVIIIPMVSSLRMVSLKEQVDEYKPQSVITSDNVGIQIDAVLFFQIVDPVKAIYEVENYFVALEMLTMTTLRDIIGEMTLDECLTSRERINARLRVVLDDATAKWGIKVNRVEIRAIQPPGEIQLAMEKQMKAERDKRARVLEAEGDRQASILRAQGDKQAAILEAEGEKEAAVLRAAGHAQAYRELFGGIKDSHIDDKVVAIRYLEALERVANGQATKLILPYEATGILSALAGIAESLKGRVTPDGVEEASPVQAQGRQAPPPVRPPGPVGPAASPGPAGSG